MLTLEEGLTRIWLDGGEWSEWARYQLRDAEEADSKIYEAVERAVDLYRDDKLDEYHALKHIAEAADIDLDFP